MPVDHRFFVHLSMDGDSFFLIAELFPSMQKTRPVRGTCTHPTPHAIANRSRADSMRVWWKGGVSPAAFQRPGCVPSTACACLNKRSPPSVVKIITIENIRSKSGSKVCFDVHKS